MITLKRYLLTLVALLAMTTGAWADEPKVYTSAVAFADLKVGDILAEGFSLTNTEGIQFYLTANRFKENGTPRTYGGSYYASSFGAFGANGALSDGYITYTPVTDQNEDGNAWKIESIPFENTLQLVGITYDVPTPLMSLSSDGLSATMAAMPAYDATVSYQLVRDMAQGVAFSGLPEGDGCILKKDGNKYTFATAPTIALEDNISGTAQAITAEGITLSYEKKGEGDTWVAQPDDFDIAIDAVPGTYRVVAKATTGLYDGTLYSPEFTLAEAYDLTLSPATDANLKSVTVAGTAVTPTEGVIRGIEPTKKVKITTTGPDYIIRKAAVKKTGAAAAEPITVTINQSDWGNASNSFTKDGVTVSAGYIDAMYGGLMEGGSFSTSLGNFTSIVVTSKYCDASGTGWSSAGGSSQTWSGTPASSVSFGGAFMGQGQVQTTIVCTIQPNN